MRLADAKKLQVGDRVDVPYLRIVNGEILRVTPDDDPRVKLVLRVQNPGGAAFTLNYKHLRKVQCE